MNIKILLLLALLAVTADGCKKHNNITPSEPEFSQVLILGNSITYAPADPTYDWHGNWGMAATVADSDYVHILAKNFKDKNPKCTVTAKNIAAFEREYNTYPLADSLKKFHDLKPDLIILRIGENVDATVDLAAFEKHYTDLISYFKADNPSVKILAVGSFWSGKESVDVIMKKYSPFITLNVLGTDMSNYAWGQFTNSGVQQHPSNKGMKAIAQSIWLAVQGLN